jgi:hypothetical protein
LLDGEDEEAHDHLPNKDFRKSELNRARRFFSEPQDQDVFEREEEEARRHKSHRKNDSVSTDHLFQEML